MKRLLLSLTFTLLITNLFSQENLNTLTSESQQKLFFDTIEEYFEEKELKIELHTDYIIIKDSEIFNGELGLINLAQFCMQYENKYWKEIIYEHFNNMEAGKIAEKELLSNISNFDSIKKYLMLRLYPREYFSPEVRKEMLYFNFSKDVDRYIVFDLPTAIRNVTKKEFELWGVEPNIVFSRAIDNLKAKYPSKTETFSIMEGFDLNLITCSSELFNTSHALLVRDDEKLLGKYGAIIGIPNRIATATFPVNDENLYSHLERMAPIMIQMYNEGPGSTSYNLYWYYNREYTLIPLEGTGYDYSYTVPEKLKTLLKTEEIIKAASQLIMPLQTVTE